MKSRYITAVALAVSGLLLSASVLSQNPDAAQPANDPLEHHLDRRVAESTCPVT